MAKTENCTRCSHGRCGVGAYPTNGAWAGDWRDTDMEGWQKWLSR